MLAKLERQWDAAIHLIGGIAALIALPILLDAVMWTHDETVAIAAVVYVGGVVAMLGLSAAYNLSLSKAWRDALRPYDRAAIFLMVAGTYTPVLLIGLGGRSGEDLLIVVWAAAIMCAGLTLVRRRERVSPIPYLVLGWIGLVALDALVAALPAVTLILIGVGGGLYTLGVVFHRWTKLPCHNAVWHVFVLAGASCHYAAVWETLAA